MSILPISLTLLQDGYHVCFEHNTLNTAVQEPIKHRGSPGNKCGQLIYFATACEMRFPIPIQVRFPSVLRPFSRKFTGAIPTPFPSVARPFLRQFPSPIPIIPFATHCFKKEGFGSGCVQQSVSTSEVSIQLKSIFQSLAISAAR
jgi:hypothetical protein